MIKQPEYWSIPNSVNHAIWKLVSPDENLVHQLVEKNALHPVLAACLARLNITSPDEVELFLNEDWQNCFEPKNGFMHDPFLMKDMQKAVERLHRAIQNNEPIRVVTDYDVDGTTSSLILQATLSLLGHKALSYHIPDRKLEGYGLTEIAVNAAIADNISLIVTADIGVRDLIPIQLAKQKGIDVIVLDHHLPLGGSVPEDAYAVVCPPQAGCNYPNKCLAACGISFKLAQAMLSNHPKANALLRSFTKLAALGTVADVVSLRELENRAIVAIGLDALNNDPVSPGLLALLKVSEATQGDIKSETIGFRIGPRINAAGRLANASLIIDLLHARNTVQATPLALELDELNRTRKDIQENMVRIALDEFHDKQDPFLFIVHDEDSFWHSGVNGIVAGRVRENLHRPTAVATKTGKIITGSIRSIPGVHAVQALDSISQYLVRFGGHAAAAGFSFEDTYLDQVKRGLSNAVIEQLGKPYETPIHEVHDFIDENESLDNLYNQLCKLEPCGSGNCQPVLCMKNIILKRFRFMKGIHFSADIEHKNETMRAIWWNAPDELLLNPQVIDGSFFNHHLDIIGSLKKEEFRGQTNFTLQITDMRLANTTND